MPKFASGFVIDEFIGGLIGDGIVYVVYGDINKPTPPITPKPKPVPTPVTPVEPQPKPATATQAGDIGRPSGGYSLWSR